MTDFLSDAWFEELNEALGRATPGPLEADQVYRVVIELDNGPSSRPHAITFTLAPTGASVAPGDHLGADTVVRIAYLDALALFEGRLESTSALRDGRVKVRGDIGVFVPFLGWLRAAHPLAP